MTTENLVTIDFESELAKNNNEIDVIEKKNQNSQEIDFIVEDVCFSDHHHQNNLEDTETILNESQPLLGGDCHDHITYNQFPGKYIVEKSSRNHFKCISHTPQPKSGS